MIDEDLDDFEWDAKLKPKERLFCIHYCSDSETFLNA